MIKSGYSLGHLRSHMTLFVQWLQSLCYAQGAYSVANAGVHTVRNRLADCLASNPLQF